MVKDYTQTLQQPFAILQQYQKDLSFEAPGALYFFAGNVKDDPQYNMTWSNRYEQMDTLIYENIFTINVEATYDDTRLYIIELVYGAIISLHEDYIDHHPGLLSVDVPYHLFPFIRFILEQQARQGGFPYLLLPLINFREHFVKKQQENIQ